MQGSTGQNGSDGFYDWGKMSITVTNRCNLRCKMCGWTRGERLTLSEETAMHCADFAERRGFREVEIGGGEPTLVDYFWRLLDRLCKMQGPDIKLVTNGVTLTDEDIETLVGYPDLNVQISIDGIGASHDDIRGVAGAFERSADSLERLAAAGCPKLSVNTVVQRSNLADMGKVYERFKHLPLRFHAFSLIEGQELWQEQLFKPQEHAEVERTLRGVMERAEADGRDVVLTDSLLRAFARQVRYPYFSMHPGAGCSVLRKAMIITPDGHALPCLHYGWLQHPEQRDIAKRGLDAIVDDPALRAELMKTISGRGCRGCTTMCYNWDETFRNKVMQPSGRHKVRQVLLCGREQARERFPWVLPIYRRIKHYLNLPNPPGYPHSMK